MTLFSYTKAHRNNRTHLLSMAGVGVWQMVDTLRVITPYASRVEFDALGEL